MSKKRILNPELVPYKQDKLNSGDVIGYVGGLPLRYGQNVNVPTNLNEVLESTSSGKIVRKELVPYKQDTLTKDSVLARINGTPLKYGANLEVFGMGGDNGESLLTEEVGNNIFNYETVEADSAITADKGNVVGLQGMVVSDWIAVKPSTNYTFKARYIVVWFDSSKTYISASPSSESSKTTLESPENAAYMRFSFNAHSYLPEKMMVNIGEVLMEFESYHRRIVLKPEITKNLFKKKYSLEISTVKLPTNGISTPPNLCLISTRNIYEEGKTPNYSGYLYLDIVAQKLYYSSASPDNPTYLCDWDKSLANNEGCENYCAIITDDGDILFMRNWKRQNPIVYPHEDYTHPYVVDFGTAKKPYGCLMGSSAVAFKGGSVCYGDYTPHSQDQETNNDGRCIWKISKPYNKPANWVKAHIFKHVYFSSPLSSEPNNEIGHIHAVNYDWMNDVLYCTTGDIDRHCRLWYSLDKGDTWQAVPNAVGALSGNAQAEGQKWRFVNMIFTKDYIYWATDSFFYEHNLMRIRRGANGVADADTLEKITNLEVGMSKGNSQATYAMAYIREPNGLLIIDRAEPRTDKMLDVKFFSFEDNSLYICATINRAETDASSLDVETRIGLPNQTTMMYQPENGNFIMCGGGTVIRPHNTELFNNSKSNYVGALKLRVVKA